MSLDRLEFCLVATTGVPKSEPASRAPFSSSGLLFAHATYMLKILNLLPLSCVPFPCLPSFANNRPRLSAILPLSMRPPPYPSPPSVLIRVLF